MQKDGYIELIREIKNFIGEDWFNAECDKAGKFPDSKNTHPLVFSWINTDYYLKNTKSLRNLEIIPRNDMLNILMIGTYLRLIGKTKVCDLSGNILGMTVKEFFQKKLRAAEKFDSALYELKVASLYLREGYTVYFIDDKDTQPEFLVKIKGETIYVECKRIENRPIQKVEEDTIRKLVRKVEKLLLAKKVGVLVVCPNSIINEDGWMEKVIQKLIGSDGATIVEQVGEYIFNIIPPLPMVVLPGYDAQLNASIFYEKYLEPHLEKQMKGYSVLDKNSIFEIMAVNVTPEMPPYQSYRIQGYFGVMFQSRPAIIYGIGKKIKKAYRQLPAGCNGLVYVECPPLVATDEEIDEFWRIIKKQLDSISRINALVITGVDTDINNNSMKHISNIFINTNSSCSHLPSDFHIMPLLDNFELN